MRVRCHIFHKLASISISLVLVLALSSCASESAPTSLKANIILLDISGSSTDSIGTYNDQDHSPSSLSERRSQLEEAFRNAVVSKTAVYFGFVRTGYGVTDISTLVSPSLILDINNVLSTDVPNEKLMKETSDGISQAWQDAIRQEREKPDSCSTEPIVKIITNASNAAVSDENTRRIATKLCSSASNGIYQFEQLKGDPGDIGSDIQAAVDRSLQKLASDERRLLNSDGKQVVLIPTLILVSDLLQVTNGVSKTKEVSATTEPKQACDLAKQESKNFTSPLTGGISLISDGFAGTIKEVNQSDRDKLRKYWECWFTTRNIDDVNVGAKGIDLGAL